MCTSLVLLDAGLDARTTSDADQNPRIWSLQIIGWAEGSYKANHRPIDLFAMYKSVQSAGGFPTEKNEYGLCFVMSKR